jgi:dihydroorotate dehydrogenase (fumarate)
MADLSTTYMGLKLRNPLIVASCDLTNSAEGVKKCSDAGAGAVVLKSLFEEQITAETRIAEQDMWLYGHSEAFEYVEKMGMAMGSREYLKVIQDARAASDVPVIASLNCISPRWWVDYARQIAAAGADALELNVAVMPSDSRRTGQEIENVYLDIVGALAGEIDIPFAVKIGAHFSSIAWMADRLARRGVSALVLFNRFYQLDVDIDKMELAPGLKLSSPDEISLPLRWIGLLAGRVKCDLAATTGAHDAGGLIKQLLVGASAVQVCSGLYLKGVEHMGKILADLEAWMDKHGFAAIDDFRGKLSQEESQHPELFERLQYIKTYTGGK